MNLQSCKNFKWKIGGDVGKINKQSKVNSVLQNKKIFCNSQNSNWVIKKNEYKKKIETPKKIKQN